jgi:tRNA-splicing ligase RtcB
VLPGTQQTRRREDLAFLPAEMWDGDKFLIWVAFCLAYAAENRKRLIQRAEELLFTAVPGERLAYVDTPHNYARREHLDGRAVVVHRRGAARVEPGVWACVAGSARSGNWIVEGVGNAGALFSCPHGAGRRWAAGEGWDRLTEEAPLRLEGLARVAHHLRPLAAS